MTGHLKVSIVCVLVSISVAPAFAQTRWQLPDGVTWEPVPPAVFPEGTVGPITFAEPEFPDGTVVDGLLVTTLDGVPLPGPLSFGFSSSDATIGDIGPGNITFVQTPNMEGDATGTLTIDFGIDSTSATFGFALNCGPPVIDAATARAFDSGGSPVGSPVSVDGLDFGSFAENELTIAPGVDFRSLEVTFAGSGTCPRFAFDNLVYDARPVPTLGRLGLVVLAVLLLLASGWVMSRRHA